jgi:uncharacterized protein
MKYRFRIVVISLFSVLVLLSVSQLPKLAINFEFSQFFPKGDSDLIYYEEFIKDFENDDNLLLIAVENSRRSVFDTSFLSKIASVSDALRDHVLVKNVASLTTLRTPIKTPFGFTTIPSIHSDDGDLLKQDSTLLQDKNRFSSYFISKHNEATLLAVKTLDKVDVFYSQKLMYAVDSIMRAHHVKKENIHITGRAAFQSELVAVQKKEIMISTAIAGLLVTFILYWIFGKYKPVIIAVGSILISLVLFLGLLAGLKIELNILAGLYPVLILIVGCSDVVHIMTKYIDDVTDDENRVALAIQVLKEVGLSTALTAATSAIGFISLGTSRLQVIQQFGLNAGLGIIIAFFTVAILVPTLLTFCKKNDLKKKGSNSEKLSAFAMNAYQFGTKKPRRILMIFGVVTAICIYGTTLISTDYKLINSLPRGHKLTSDFMYFEKYFGGFRPLEFGVHIKAPYTTDSFIVIKELDKLENKLKSYGSIENVISLVTLYKNVHMAHHANDAEKLTLPDNESDFFKYTQLINKGSSSAFNVLVNEDKTKARVSAKMKDVGADSIKNITASLNTYIKDSLRSDIITVRQTGAGLIVDKNSVYVTQNLILGLFYSILTTALIMAFLVKSLKMVFIFTLTNVLPLLFGGAVLGYFGIALEAGVSVIFAIIFGVAVDDSIHFLSRFNLLKNKGLPLEEAIQHTFIDTGKAIVLTSIILFVGFLVMLTSSQPHSTYVGILISFTLGVAVFCDLYLLPILLRKAYGEHA